MGVSSCMNRLDGFPEGCRWRGKEPGPEVITRQPAAPLWFGAALTSARGRGRTPASGNEVTSRMHTPRMQSARRLFAMIVVAAAVAAPTRLVAQQMLTDKIMRLDGRWVLEPEKGWGGICGVPVSDE